jgi:hypothetical protein
MDLLYFVDLWYQIWKSLTEAEWGFAFNLVIEISVLLWTRLYLNTLGRGSSVDIVTRYGVDCPGVEPRWEEDFPQPSIPAPGPTQRPIQWLPGLFRGGQASGAWRSPPTPSSAEAKERVELYLYAPSGPSWHVIGWALPLPLPLTQCCPDGSNNRRLAAPSLLAYVSDNLRYLDHTCTVPCTTCIKFKFEIWSSVRAQPRTPSAIAPS